MRRAKTRLFRQALRCGGCRSAALRAAGLAHPAFRRRGVVLRICHKAGRGEPEGLVPAPDQDSAAAALEAEALRRALHGVSLPVFHQGRECGSTVKHSDQLLMFLLKCRLPERYGAGREPALEAADPAGPAAARRPVLLDIDLSAADEPEGALDGEMGDKDGET